MTKNDTAVKDEEVKQDTSVEEPAPQATREPEVAESKDPEKALEETEVSLEDLDETEDEPAEKSEGEVEETKEQPQGEEKPLTPKSENRFQTLANENRDLKERIARLQQQETQFATEQELLGEVNPETGEYYTPQEVERIAFAQTREAQAQQAAQERYQLEVQQNQETIKSEATKALEEFPMFDEHSKEYNAERAAQADQLLKQSLIFDNQGVLVGSSISPYQLYKTINDSVMSSDPQRQAQAQRATEQMLASADSPGGSSQATKTKPDPLLAGFDEEAARP